VGGGGGGNEGAQLQAQLEVLALEIRATNEDFVKKVVFKKESPKVRVLRWSVDGEEDTEFRCPETYSALCDSLRKWNSMRDGDVLYYFPADLVELDASNRQKLNERSFAAWLEYGETRPVLPRVWVYPGTAGKSPEQAPRSAQPGKVAAATYGLGVEPRTSSPSGTAQGADRVGRQVPCVPLCYHFRRELRLSRGGSHFTALPSSTEDHRYTSHQYSSRGSLRSD